MNQSNPILAKRIAELERYVSNTKNTANTLLEENKQLLVELALVKDLLESSQLSEATAKQYAEEVDKQNQALEAQVEALQRSAVPNEHGKNRYGLDAAYFRNVINRELNHSLMDFKPSELARVFARLSRTADDSVLLENEFIGNHLRQVRADAVNDFIEFMYKSKDCQLCSESLDKANVYHASILAGKE